MSIGPNLQILLRARLDRLRATAGPSMTPGCFAAQLVLRSPDNEGIQAWTCTHEHSTWGLAYVCAVDQLDRLRFGD